MSVQFEENGGIENRFDSLDNQPQASGLAGLVLRTGIVKTKRAANVLLLVICVICIAVSAVLLMGFETNSVLNGSSDVNLPPVVERLRTNR